MPIPGPGTAISMNTLATEFGGTVPHSLSEYYRGGGLVPNAPVVLERAAQYIRNEGVLNCQQD